jgi:hypothetical protein
MSKTHLITAAAVIASIGTAVIATPASALRGIDTDLGIYDANNRFVGQPQGEDQFFVAYGGRWYSEDWDPPTGLARDAIFAHVSANCSDPHPFYLFNGDQFVGPPLIRFDGVNLWTAKPGTETTIAVGSIWYAGGDSLTPSCDTYPYTVTVAEPQFVGTPPNFRAPFQVR